MDTDTKKTPDRYTLISVRLPVGQIDVLDECERLTGQNRTDLIREAISSYIYPLCIRLRDKAVSK